MASKISAEIEETFDEFDQNNDGVLTREEIIKALGGALSVEMIDNIIKEADINQDGKSTSMNSATL